LEPDKALGDDIVKGAAIATSPGKNLLSALKKNKFEKFFGNLS
jgi:hypothetical protein